MSDMTKRFLDVRNHGFKRVACIAPRVFVGNPKANLAEHTKWFDLANNSGVQYVVAPELGLTAYSCKDLFQQEVLQRAAIEALGNLAEESRRWPSMMITVGVPIAFQSGLYNCAATILNGNVLGLSAKTYLPTYGEFEEARWFTPAFMLPKDAVVKILGKKLNIGNDLIFVSEDDPNFQLYVEVCEDGWKDPTPSSFARLAGANILANCSASNVTIGKPEYRRSLITGKSAISGSVYLYAAAGFGEDVSDLGWDGHCMITERGTLLAESTRYDVRGDMIHRDVNLRAVVQDYRREQTNAHCAFLNQRPFRRIEFSEADGNAPVYRKLYRKVDPFPFVPRDPASRNDRCREAFNTLSSVLQRKLLELPEGRRNIIGGISGGLDSTLMALIAAYTLDQAGLPRSKLIFTTLPGYGTSDETYEDAHALMRLLGADASEYSIKPVTEELFRVMNFDPERDGWQKVVSENPQAWAREMILLSISAKRGGIVLGTGDLSESMVGWCTIFGDHVSHYHINASVPKTLVKSLVEWMRDNVFNGPENEELRQVLTRICNRVVSPELLPLTADRQISQKTDDELGPADLRDFFGYWFVRFGFTPSLIARMCYHAFEGAYEIGVIKKWLGEFLVRFFRNQFKRSMAPLGPKIGSVSLSQRGDWRMPTSAEVSAWIAELEANVQDERGEDM